MAALALLLGQVSTLMAGIAARNAQPVYFVKSVFRV